MVRNGGSWTQRYDAEQNPTLKYRGMFSSGTAAMCFPDPRRVISIERVKHPRVNIRAARLM